jgi:hypothetical protein
MRCTILCPRVFLVNKQLVVFSIVVLFVSCTVYCTSELKYISHRVFHPFSFLFLIYVISSYLIFNKLQIFVCFITCILDPLNLSISQSIYLLLLNARLYFNIFFTVFDNHFSCFLSFSQHSSRRLGQSG